MTRAVFVVVIMAVLSAPAAAQALPAFDQTRFYDQPAFDRAIAPYTQAIARNANDARAHYWLGMAYLHMLRLYRFGLAPFAAGFAPRAVASLEQSLRLQAAPEVMLALLDAYVLVGAWDKHNALLERVSALARPLPIR